MKTLNKLVLVEGEGGLTGGCRPVCFSCLRSRSSSCRSRGEGNWPRHLIGAGCLGLRWVRRGLGRVELPFRISSVSSTSWSWRGLDWVLMESYSS